MIIISSLVFILSCIMHASHQILYFKHCFRHNLHRCIVFHACNPNRNDLNASFDFTILLLKQNTVK